MLVVGSLAILGAVGRQRRWGQCRRRGTQTVGAVDKAQAQVNARKARRPAPWLSTRTLISGSMPQRRRRAPSGDIERCAQLTLGENATLVVDDFVYDPFTSRGELSLRVVKGAFLYVGGGWKG